MKTRDIAGERETAQSRSERSGTFFYVFSKGGVCPHCKAVIISVFRVI